LVGVFVMVVERVVGTVQVELAQPFEAIAIKPPPPRYTCADDWPAIFAWVDFFEPRMTNGALAELLEVAEKTVANARAAHKWPQMGRRGKIGKNRAEIRKLKETNSERFCYAEDINEEGASAR
jgi:hypothetical protein